MSSPFPFGFPWPTALYLTLYVATLVLHWVFMNYVLAGSAYVVMARVFRAGADRRDPIDTLLREWLPFMLSGAITAGIAPLLFLQILYQYQFYSANLLLFHRWMAIVPTLIAGFYLLYLLRSSRFPNWPLPIRMAVACAAFCCFVFVAWSWTENHLLSMNQSVWAELYGSNRMLYQSKDVLPRVAMWLAMAVAPMATIMAWQLWYAARRNDQNESTARRVSMIALAGLLLFVATAAVYASVLSANQREALGQPASRPYLVLAILGLALQISAWLAQLSTGRLATSWLLLASAGVVCAHVGVAVGREALRIVAIDFPALYGRHAEASENGGLLVFVFFLVVTSCLIVLSLRIVQQGSRQDT